MITAYINYLKQVRALSTRTTEEYEKELRAFARWANKELNARWSELKREDFESHVKYMNEQGLQPATIKKRMTAIRGIYDYMLHRRLIEENPARWVQTPRIKDTLPTTAEVEKVDAYLAATPIDKTDIDVKVATALMLEGGLRLEETIQIDRTDINFLLRTIRITGKGGKQRIIFYGERTAKMLNEYKQWRTGRILNIPTGTTLRWAMYKYAGPYVKGIHPHMLRHTFACTMLNKGMSLKTLSQLMGHASTATTERYARMSTETLRREYEHANL